MSDFPSTESPQPQSGATHSLPEPAPASPPPGDAGHPSSGRDSYSQQPPAAEVDPGVIQSLSEYSRQYGVEPAHQEAAVSWLRSMIDQGESLAKVPVDHGYDLSSFGFEGEGLALANAFANEMAKAGASQDEVYALIRWYEDLADDDGSTPSAAVDDADLGAMDLEDANRARVSLSPVWGGEYGTNIRLINRYLDNLPAKEREAYETGVTKDGVLLLNDPATLQKLAQEARKQGQVEGSSPRGELAELERIMREDRRRWFSKGEGEALQARYRDLVREGPAAEKPLPTDTEAIDREIAQIQKLMRENRKAYNSDPAVQSRFRQLLMKRG